MKPNSFKELEEKFGKAPDKEKIEKDLNKSMGLFRLIGNSADLYLTQFFGALSNSIGANAHKTPKTRKKPHEDDHSDDDLGRNNYNNNERP